MFTEKKEYYWKKKEEHFLDFEGNRNLYYLKLDLIVGQVFFGSKTEQANRKNKFTEEEAKALVGEKDFKKLIAEEVD